MSPRSLVTYLQTHSRVTLVANITGKGLGPRIFTGHRQEGGKTVLTFAVPREPRPYDEFLPSVPETEISYMTLKEGIIIEPIKNGMGDDGFRIRRTSDDTIIAVYAIGEVDV